jgi:hypothetical protein
MSGWVFIWMDCDDGDGESESEFSLLSTESVQSSPSLFLCFTSRALAGRGLVSGVEYCMYVMNRLRDWMNSNMIYSEPPITVTIFILDLVVILKRVINIFLLHSESESSHQRGVLTIRPTSNFDILNIQILSEQLDI